MIEIDPWAWTTFFVVVVVLIAIDFRSTRDERASAVGHAARWTAIWVGVGLVFGLGIAIAYGIDAGEQYFAAYLLEKSLSVDNMFVFLLIFSQLGIPPLHQHRVLLLGILGALVMRAVMIAAGVYLLTRIHWIIYVFAVLLLVSAVRLMFAKERERRFIRESCEACGTWVGRFVPVTPSMEGGRFLHRTGGRLVATPLFVALIIVETTDLVFALDSIPAVLAITRDPFLVYSSNVFAMLGLRSLYFLLGSTIERLRYLRPALSLILAFVAVKMLLDRVVPIGAAASLFVMAVVLAVAVVASLRSGPRCAR